MIPVRLMNGHVVGMWVYLQYLHVPDILEMRWSDVPTRALGCSIISNQPDPRWSSHSHPGTSCSSSRGGDTRQSEAGSSHSLARVSGPVSMCRVWARLGAATPAMNAAWFLQFPLLIHSPQHSSPRRGRLRPHDAASCLACC